MTDPNANPNPGVVTSALDSLVGAGKKFADPEALARGKVEADSFIETLKREKQEAVQLATELQREKAKLEGKLSILERLERQPSSNSETPLTPQVPNPEPPLKGLTEEDVLKVVEQSKNAERMARNKSEVDAVLAKQLGADAPAYLAQKAAELGIDKASLNQLALTSPNAFYSMIGINPNPSTGNTRYVPSGPGATPSASKEIRNNSYYEKLKKEMGVLPFIRDVGLQQQRHRDMQALGDAWDS